MNLGYHLQNHMPGKSAHCRPVLNVRSKVNLHIRIGRSLTVKYTIFINLFVKEIFRIPVFHIQVCSRGQIALVRCGRRNGTRIHQRNRRNLSALQLGALPIREIPCGMPDAEAIIRRGVSGSKARPAESGFQNRSCLHKRCGRTIPDQLHVNRHGCRIDA